MRGTGEAYPQKDFVILVAQVQVQCYNNRTMKLTTSKKPSLKCPKCNGTGQAELPAALLETFEIIKKHGPITVVRIREKITDSISITGVGQRVTDLVNAKLVVSKKNGRSREFSVAAKKK